MLLLPLGAFIRKAKKHDDKLNRQSATHATRAAKGTRKKSNIMAHGVRNVLLAPYAVRMACFNAVQSNVTSLHKDHAASFLISFPQSIGPHRLISLLPQQHESLLFLRSQPYVD